MNVRKITQGLFLLLPLACSADDIDADAGPACRGGKCDEADGTSECDVANKTGAGGSGLADVFNHNDPIANAIFKKGDSCPTSYAAVIEKLEEFDNEGCRMRSAVVSETAQVRGTPTSYRTVTTRECDNRPSHGLLSSLFGLNLSQKNLPGNFEVIAFDGEAGVFNYYDVEGGEWSFHGNSKQFVDGSEARCAQCHTGGGLIMKELDAPWLHWEGDTTTPGADDLVTKHAKLLGDKTDGIEVEGIVLAGNDAWLQTRMQHMVEKADVEKLLEPLFCSVEMNIGSATSSAGGEIFSVPNDVLMDSTLGFDSVQMPNEVYQAAIAKSGQRIQDRGGKALLDQDGNRVVDTHFTFSFPERAAADRSYVDRLVQDQIVDSEFVGDVLAIDFTRPIFSEERCDLKRFAPDLGKLLAEPKPEPDPGEPPKVETGNCCDERSEKGCSIPEIQQCVCDNDSFCCDSNWDSACVSQLRGNDSGNQLDGDCKAFVGVCGEGDGGSQGRDVVTDLPTKIREGFIANLQAANPAPDSPEGQLLLALTRTDGDGHREAASAFAATCEARDKAAFMDDVLMVLSARRDEARSHEVMEFAETLVVDDLQPAGSARLHPLTCELTDDYVPHLTEKAPDPEPMAGCLHIAEVMYDVAGGSDDGREWIKLYNACDADQSLAGMSLAWGGKDYLSGGIDLSGTVAAKSCFIIGGPESDASNGTPPVDQKETLSPNLQNGGAEADGVALMSVLEDDVQTSTVPLDAVIYGDANTSGLIDASGQARDPHVGNAPAGGSLVRTDRDTWEAVAAPVASTCPDF